MSVSAISSNSISQGLQSYFQQRQTDLKQLGKALQSGDLAGAQQAYNAIVALRQNGPSPTAAAFLRPARQADFASIGQALQSGDLAGARQAFPKLQSTFSFNHQLRGFDPGPAPVVSTTVTSAASSGSDASATSSAPAVNIPAEIVLNLRNIGNNSNPEQVTINLSNGPNGGERVSISVGPAESQCGANQHQSETRKQ